MKKKYLFLISSLFLASNIHADSAVIVDNSTVDSVYDSATGSLSIPLIDIGVQRYSSNLTFKKLSQNADGSYSTVTTISPLASAYDSTGIVVDPGFDTTIAANLKNFLLAHTQSLANGGLGKPGAIIRVEMDGKVWRGSTGLRRVNSSELLNFSDRHRIGSLTKTFVDNALMQLVDQGKVGLDTTIDTYLPNVNVPNKSIITIRDLIAHRSGLYNYVVDPTFTGIQYNLAVNPLKVYSRQDLLDIANNQPVNYIPNPAAPVYKYTNTGLTLAGLIIEAVTGQSVESVVKASTIDKLGLKRTEFPTKDPGIQSNYMHGHADYNNDGILSSYNGDLKQAAWIDPNNGNTVPAFKAQEIVSYLDPSVAWAAGAMISNHEDLSKWMKAYVDGTLLTTKGLQKQVLTDCLPSAPDYGASYCLGLVKVAWPFTHVSGNSTSTEVGLPINNDPNHIYYGHLGQIQGYDNAVFRNTARNITIGLTNNNYFISTDSNYGTGVLMFYLLNIVDPQPAANKAIRQKAAIAPLNAEDLGGQ